ncbi:polysaccharide pyruvyl transferase family protein [Peribacillus frigoritolerans]|uniref:polysaccharide pyruvyl transferase family protein n=1 Tax=Peribacillus frigoritolerans TaxID=450367 RepID=UPI0025707580|nr:polysaccharide pyruvyl transferase family protein [Peribacillus frigoritolerans]WJE46135.1 polysaccharide pyruvyl transferase family protein [Peribacillus frigoritolerans]
MKKSVLVSFFNSHNLGDCLIADMLYEMVSERFVTKKYSYTGKTPNIINNINEINSQKSLKSNIKGSIYKVLKKYDLNVFIYTYRMLLRGSKSYPEFETIIHNADILVIGGGNMIFDIDKYSNSALRFNNLVSIAKKRGIKVFAISIGIGPFATLKQEIKAVEALTQCDYISFRDQKSYDIYAKYSNELKDVYVSIDPVFFLPYCIKPSVTKNIIIGINVFNNKLINDSEEKYKQLINGYVKLAKGLSNELDTKIVLFSTDLSDYPAVRDVYKCLSTEQNIEVRDIDGIESLVKLYSELSVLVGTRMHSMIIAYTQYIPIIGISWQQKVDALFDIIDSKDSIFNYNNIDRDSETIIDCCKRKLVNLEVEKDNIKETLNQIRNNRNIDKHILTNLSQENYQEHEHNTHM